MKLGGGREPVGFCRQSRFRADDRSPESPDESVRTRFALVRDCSLMSFNANISRYAYSETCPRCSPVYPGSVVLDFCGLVSCSLSGTLGGSPRNR